MLTKRNATALRSGLPTPLLISLLTVKRFSLFPPFLPVQTFRSGTSGVRRGDPFGLASEATLHGILFFKQAGNFFDGKAGHQRFFALDRGVDDLALLLLEIQDLFLHGTAGDQFVGSHYLGLANAV